MTNNININANPELRHALIANITEALDQRKTELLNKVASKTEKYFDFATIQSIFTDFFVDGSRVYGLDGTDNLAKDAYRLIIGKYDPRHRDADGNITGKSKNISNRETLAILKNILIMVREQKRFTAVEYRPAPKDAVYIQGGVLFFDVALKIADIEKVYPNITSRYAEVDMDFIARTLPKTIYADFESIAKVALLRRYDYGDRKKMLVWLRAVTNAGKTHLWKTIQTLFGSEPVDFETIGTKDDKAAINKIGVCSSLVVVKEEFSVFFRNYKEVQAPLKIRTLGASDFYTISLPAALLFSHEDHVQEADQQILNRLYKIDNNLGDIDALFKNEKEREDFDVFSKVFVYQTVMNLKAELDAVFEDRVAFRELVAAWDKELSKFDASVLIGTPEDAIKGALRGLVESYHDDVYAADDWKTVAVEYKKRYGVEITKHALYIKSLTGNRLFHRNIAAIMKDQVTANRLRSVDYNLGGITPESLGFTSKQRHNTNYQCMDIDSD